MSTTDAVFAERSVRSEMSIRVFISHSSMNQELAESVAD